ncbi:MAG: hypothetical protein IJ225_10590 [Solobacterium sp.]|nr:hypothetical protein [Solobacterium sp.]
MKTAILVKKLKNNDGATLMLALLFFIMCAVVGSIVLTSASGVSGQLATMKKDDQEYYAVSSATRYIRDSLEDVEFTVTDVATEGADGTVTYTDGVLIETGAAADDSSLLKDMLSQCFDGYLSLEKENRWKSNVDFYYLGNAIAGVEKKLTVGGDTYGELDVIVKLSMNRYGGILAKVYQQDGTYILQLEADAKVDTSEKTITIGDHTYQTTRTITIKYVAENIRIRKVTTK